MMTCVINPKTKLTYCGRKRTKVKRYVLEFHDGHLAEGMYRCNVCKEAMKKEGK